jgi:hypothetical protein
VGLLDKLQFWKKDDFTPSYDAPPDLPPESHDVLQTPDPMRDQFTPATNDPFTSASPQYPQPAAFPGTGSRQPQQSQYEEPSVHPRDVELILAKLDAIKSEMDALHQRVRKIEQSVEAPGQKAKYW